MIKERIEALRQALKENDADLYYITTSDDHMSEYIPEYYKILRYFSAFSGSLGTLLIGREKAYLFVDGRYHLQADEDTKDTGIEVIHLGLPGAMDVLPFLKAHYPNSTIALDASLTSSLFAKALKAQGHKIKDLDLASPLMEQRCPLNREELFALDEKYTGLSRKEKLDKVFYCLNGKCHIVSGLEAIAYALNLRGNDIACTPVFMAFLVFLKDEVYLFIDKERLNEDILMDLYQDGIIIRDYDTFYDFLTKIRHETILLDENKTNYKTILSLNKDNQIIHTGSPLDTFKAIKNPVEQENSRQAHIYDGVAMVRFLKWLKEQDKTQLTEYTVAEYLNQCRLTYKAFDLSFKPIVAYNANAAMMHYAPHKDHCAALANEGILLIDSGGQYFEGTTDITRTVALGPVDDEIKKYFTMVLKAVFNLSEVVFKPGMSGCQLDILARHDFWQQGIDYLCGTGHGVGQVLSVHEMPPNIRYQRTVSGSEQVPFKPGHITSDEPGVYFEGRFGIRTENMLLCKEVMQTAYGTFLGFETLTLCPIDLELIDEETLDQKTRECLNRYHERVYDTLLPYLNEAEASFLKEATRSI